ncbi:MAG: (d)CMP kinase [Tissierellia bacterium]|nr:(d)CMP kinase [Tissierellia bacterium]
MIKNIQIAIDGPSGAGKSTVAKRLAQKLNYDYIDTGAMYRAFALKLILNGYNSANIDDSIISKLIDSADIDFHEGNILLDGENVETKIRNEKIGILASDLSALKIVRDALVDKQRKIARSKSVIMDGRDIGTVVLKNADLKIYLTADPYTRAKRRYIDLLDSGVKTSLEETLDQILKRDYNDMNRKHSPLKKADDAIKLDTTNLNLDETVAKIIEILEEKINVL